MPTNRKYTSRSQQTTLTSAVTSGGTTINVANASTLFATVSAGDITGGTTFTVVLDPDTALEEIVEVTGASSNTLTITRSVDAVGTATDHSAGAVVRHMVIGRDLREANEHINATGTVHGLASTGGVVVGTAQTQTLTNKTLTTPVVAGATLSGTITSTATITGGTLTGAIVTGLSAPSNGSDATTKTYVDSILGSAVAASTSATSAAASATAAATSAASAATSASSAATSASSALTSQTAAATSATSAAASATAAATSAGTATTQAAAASTSATSAAASATAAATSASSAATSASSAATSATASATSAAAALTSANSAATSATAAAGSETAASGSQTAAATSATSAAASATAAATSATSAAASQTAAATSAASAATSATAAATSAASAAVSATAAATSATSSAASYTAYDQRYLGSKSSAPTLDNQGNALITGTTYWNTSTTTMYVWSGSAWIAISTTGYSAPTLGSTTIPSGATVTTIADLTLTTPNLGTPSAATLTNATGLPISGLVPSTSTAIGVGSINLGHASDTVLTRNAAGVLAVNGYVIPDVSSVNILSQKSLSSTKEVVSISATAATGTINFDTGGANIMYYTSNATGNWTLNVRGGVATTLNTNLSIGQTATIVFLVTNGATAYYPTALTIDGSAQTVKWQGGTAPTSGNASSIDAYTYTIIKTAVSTYTVLGSQSKFA